MMGNKYPQFKNPTAALYKRILICTFPNCFEQTEVTNIEQIWLDDEDSKSALLNWIMVGVRRLFRNNKFTDNMDWEEKQRIFALSEDPLTSFLEQNVIFAPAENIAKSRLQDAADRYCAENKVPPEDIKKAKLQQIAQLTVAYKIKDKQIKMDIDGVKKPVWHWIGVRLKTKEEQDKEQQSEFVTTQTPTDQSSTENKDVRVSQKSVTSVTSLPENENVPGVTKVTQKNKTPETFSNATKNTVGAYWPVPTTTRCDDCYHTTEPEEMWCVRMPDKATKFLCSAKLKDLQKHWPEIEWVMIPNPLSGETVCVC